MNKLDSMSIPVVMPEILTKESIANKDSNALLGDLLSVQQKILQITSFISSTEGLNQQTLNEVGKVVKNLHGNQEVMLAVLFNRNPL